MAGGGRLVVTSFTYHHQSQSRHSDIFSGLMNLRRAGARHRTCLAGERRRFDAPLLTGLLGNVQTIERCVRKLATIFETTLVICSLSKC